MSSKVDPAPGASIYRACQMGDILRVKEILLEGFPPNEPNAYGCVALHYAVKNVALCAEVLARGVHDEDDEAKVGILCKQVRLLPSKQSMQATCRPNIWVPVSLSPLIRSRRDNHSSRPLSVVI